MSVAPHLLLPYARVAGTYARGGYEAAPASLARPAAVAAAPSSPKRSLGTTSVGAGGGGWGFGEGGGGGGAGGSGTLRGAAASTTSFSELRGMKRRNIAPAHGPRDAFLHPPTSSAEVGWRAHEAVVGSGFGATAFRPG